MLALNKEHQTTPLSLRLNKHFRIKSASKDKFKLQPEMLTVKSRRKDNLQEVKRIFSESRNKKSASLETAIKIKITKEELQRRFERAERNAKKKNIVYDCVKTEQQTYTDQHRNSNTRIGKTEQILLNTQRQPTFFNPIHPSSNQKSEQNSKLSAEPQKFKKIKNDKQPKGKYRCRVNQFVFDHCRKKSSVNKEQQQNLDQFWKNVNQSLILAGKQEEQFSKDLQQFVEHFVTQ